MSMAAAVAGCERRTTMIEAFPPGSYASPWVLVGDVWSGSFEQARSGLGDEADEWAKFEPQQVWLATYAHDQHVKERLTVRALAFASRESARRAYEYFEPVGPERREFKAGDRGCWSRDGVLFVWGRVVFDIFGNDPSRGAIPEQAAYLAGHLEKRMTRELPESPR